MAAPPHRRLIWRPARWIAGAIAAAVVLFLLAAWIGSSIPRNDDWQQPTPTDPGAVEIMVETNGVHTALVLPAITPERNWHATFPPADVARPDREYSHVSISWGERQVFLETPTWWDLSPVTVLRILGVGGDGLLHVAHYVRPAPGADIRTLRLTRAQYRRLVARIDRVIPRGNAVRHAGYGHYDVFYDAPGRYTFRNTCNQWTSDTLAAAGVKTGWWTPFAGGVMKWVPRPAG
ncbi:TIGR02117 family protein [Tsuneonella sp. HG222]